MAERPGDGRDHDVYLLHGATDAPQLRGDAPVFLHGEAIEWPTFDPAQGPHHSRPVDVARGAEFGPEAQLGRHGHAGPDDVPPHPGVADARIDALAVIDEVPHRVGVEEVAGHSLGPPIPSYMWAMVYSLTRRLQSRRSASSAGVKTSGSSESYQASQSETASGEFDQSSA